MYRPQDSHRLLSFTHAGEYFVTRAEGHIHALILRQERVLLLRVPESAAIDAGNWSLPRAATSEQPCAPHPLLCAVPGGVAAGLESLFTALGADFGGMLRAGEIQAIEAIGELSPASWSPHRSPQAIWQVRLADTAEWKPSASVSGDWRTPAQWREAYVSGQCLLNPLLTPWLGAGLPPSHPPPWDEPVAGLRIFPVRSHTLPPATHTNAFVLGDGPYVLVDPSPADESAYQDLKHRLEQWPIAEIFLTHHHPDHHQQAARLAREWTIPLRSSADTQMRIRRRFAAQYPAELPWQIAADGDVLATCDGLPIILHAVPGHDAGQLAPAPADGRWMIVGDLIQGIGTVVIAAPEGDMTAYFASLNRVIAMQPAAIVPSHGQAMGGTHRLEETLRHREAREQQVLALSQRGLDIDDMVATLYAQVDQRLWPLARMNIESHRAKLRAEKRLD